MPPICLVQYGLLGELALFDSPTGYTVRRGDRVMVRTPRGTELGCVMREGPGERMAGVLRSAGFILRVAGEEDFRAEAAAREKAENARRVAQDLAAEMSVPLQVLDAEWIEDTRRLVLHLAGRPAAAFGRWLGVLGRLLGAAIELENAGKLFPAEAASWAGCCGTMSCGCCNDAAAAGSCDGEGSAERRCSGCANARGKAPHLLILPGSPAIAGSAPGGPAKGLPVVRV